MALEFQTAMQYVQIPFPTFWTECQELIREHFLEIATFQDIPLEPLVEFYEASEAAGTLRIYAAYAEAPTEPALVGYAIFFVAPNPHYASSLQARDDVIYLAPEWRRGHIGMRLLRFAIDALREEGVEVVYIHQKLAHGALGALLERLDFTPDERIWAKRL